MEIKQIIALLQAFENGEEIEYKYNNQNDWKLIDNLQFIDFRFVDVLYRIKPKQEYIPFNYEDDLVGKVVKLNKTCINIIYPEMLIIKKTIDGVFAGDYARLIPYQELLESWIFKDGTKCGKLA